jgi:hypothetical protein
MKYLFALTLLTLTTAVAYSQVSGTEKTAAKPNAVAQSLAAATDTSSVPAAARAGISAALGRNDRTYAISTRAGVLTATNGDRELTAAFKTSGVHVRLGKSDMAMSLLGYGYGTTLQSASKASPHASFNRVEYKRGALTEWYENGPMGVEQGFTLDKPPAQKRTGPLTIAMNLSGDLTATADQDGSELTLKDRKQQATLVYGGLTSYDATGKELHTWLDVHGSRLQLKVDDAGAEYPVVVDPWVQVARLTTAGGAAFDFLGNAVSVAQGGQALVVAASNQKVGNNLQQGAVYVFVRPTKGWATTSAFTAELTNSAGAAGDNFGYSVAISLDGKTIAVGAWQATVGKNPYQGAVYVFTRPSTGKWVTTGTPTAVLTASNGAAYDWLGSSVAFDNLSVVAGAYGHQVGNNPYQGEAYVFTEPSGGWVSGTETAQLTASDGAAWDLFGYSIAALNGTAVVGSLQATVGSNSYQGAAYVYVAPSSGWVDATENAKLVASDGQSEDLLGSSVAIDSQTDTIVVGAEAANVNGNGGQGAAYVYVEPTGGWSGEPLSQTAKLTASDGLQQDYFGTSVSINFNDTTIAVGAPLAPYFTTGKYIGPGPGKVYTYVKPSTGWANTDVYTQELVVAGGKKGSLYGISVGTNTNTLAAGAIGAETGGKTDQGAAFIAGAK